MIFFSVTRAKAGLAVGDQIDVAFYPQINEYRGARTVQLHLVDLRLSYSPRQVEERTLYDRFCRGEEISCREARSMIPSRDEFAGVWRYLVCRNGEIIDTPVRLARRISDEADLWESTLHTLVCLDVMEQVGLLKLRWEEGDYLCVKVQKRRDKKKVNLYEAPMIQKLQFIAQSVEKEPRS